MTWAESLDALLTPDSATPTGTAPLGIELTLTEHDIRPDASAVRLTARLVTSGRNGWVYGNLSWGKLRDAHSMSDYLPSHVLLLRELYALYQSGRSGQDTAYGYYGSYADDKLIDLCRFQSRQLWPMLDEVASAGVELVHGRRRLGPVMPYGNAEFCIDVTRDGVVRPAGGPPAGPRRGRHRRRGADPVHRGPGPWRGLLRPGRGPRRARSRQPAHSAGSTGQAGAGRTA